MSHYKNIAVPYGTAQIKMDYSNVIHLLDSPYCLNKMEVVAMLQVLADLEYTEVTIGMDSSDTSPCFRLWPIFVSDRQWPDTISIRELLAIPSYLELAETASSVFKEIYMEKVLNTE